MSEADYKGDEVWRPVAGYEGLYEVSSLGRVRSLDRTLPCGNARQRNHRGRMLAFGNDQHGYLQVNLWRENSYKSRKVHRLVADAFLARRPIGTEPNHIDGDKKNNAAVNLEWMTRQDNICHALAMGLRDSARGENNGSAKLTENQVREIRQLAVDGIKKRELGRRFGVSESTVGEIVRRQIWAHI